jgi:hypothetical protein
VPDAEVKAREHLAHRAAVVAPIAINSEVRVFTARLADLSVDDTIWCEQLAALLSMKHPTLWHDEDRGRFAFRLAQLGEVFKALEFLALSRRDLPPEAESIESIRISIVGTHTPGAEHVIHFGAEDAKEIEDLEKKMTCLFEPGSLNGKHRLLLVALTRVIRDLIGGVGLGSYPIAGTTDHE